MIAADRICSWGRGGASAGEAQKPLLHCSFLWLLHQSSLPSTLQGAHTGVYSQCSAALNTCCICGRGLCLRAGVPPGNSTECSFRFWRDPSLNPWLFHWLALWSQTSDLTSLSLCILIEEVSNDIKEFLG